MSSRAVPSTTPTAAATNALHYLVCIGNEARVTSGAATFVVGDISTMQRRVMIAMDACFEAGVAALKPGALCCDVNAASLEELRRAGLSDVICDQIGHVMDLEGH